MTFINVEGMFGLRTLERFALVKWETLHASQMRFFMRLLIWVVGSVCWTKIVIARDLQELWFVRGNFWAATYLSSCFNE